MIILEKDGSLLATRVSGEAPDSTAGTLELSADLLVYQGDLLDRIFAFAFDVLGLHRLDLRIHAHPAYAPGVEMIG